MNNQTTPSWIIKGLEGFLIRHGNSPLEDPPDGRTIHTIPEPPLKIGVSTAAIYHKHYAATDPTVFFEWHRTPYSGDFWNIATRIAECFEKGW